MRSFFAILLLPSTFAWDLTTYNISSSYYVSSVAVYGNRAFLALPRTSCHNNVTNPTLVEASWYNEKPTLFGKPFFLEAQQWDDCDHLQNVVSLDMEPLKSRLWVLDQGNPRCSPKIVIYNLFLKANYSIDVPSREKLSFLLVDTDTKLGGTRGYVGLDGVPHILVFSFDEFKWWKINLESTPEVVSTKFLAFARKEPTLLITGGEERAIFALDLTLIRKEFSEDEENVTVAFLGEKLGPSSGLVADFKDGLTYYMTRDFVVVRWDMRSPPRAESYNILAQSYTLLPYVSQLYTGPQNGIWALANPAPPHICTDAPHLKNRLIKLLKYNILM